MLKLSVILFYCAVITSLSSCTNYDTVIIIPIHKNGCGPASLISAYRFGSKKWNKAINKIEGLSDEEKFDYLVKKHGNIFSKHLRAQKRFDEKHGINIVDLTDLANEFHQKHQLNLPELVYNSHFLKGKMSHNELLKKTHKTLKSSLSKGFPPLLSVKTFAQQGSRWSQIHGHFVVLLEIPHSIPRDATSFKIKYMDPWGGKNKVGEIKLPEKSFYAINVATKKLEPRRSPLLEVDFSDSILGTQGLKANQPFATTLAFSISPKF